VDEVSAKGGGSVTLYTARRTGISVAEALSAQVVRDGVALLMTPSSYAVGKVVADTCVSADGHTLDLSDVFDARVFSPDIELRWHAGADAGRAVALSEQQLTIPGWEPGQRDDVARAPGSIEGYLLWGERVEPIGDGWVRSHSGRVPPVDVPAAAARPGNSVRLDVVEYVTSDAHGNVAVCEERLCGFTVQAGVSGGAR